jgi:hypothetical protein
MIEEEIVDYLDQIEYLESEVNAYKSKTTKLNKK